MNDLVIGDPAPNFDLPGTTGTVQLSQSLSNGPVVLAFYQEDGTPTCQAQLCAFRDEQELLHELGARVLAISTDTVGAHRAFAGEQGLPFPLLSDVDGSVARAYGVWDAESRRARRAVFVVGADGSVLLALPWYNPANTSQYEQIFRALGLEG